VSPGVAHAPTTLSAKVSVGFLQRPPEHPYNQDKTRIRADVLHPVTDVLDSRAARKLLKEYQQYISTPHVNQWGLPLGFSITHYLAVLADSVKYDHFVE
jgi:hypothetical protein